MVDPLAKRIEQLRPQADSRQRGPSFGMVANSAQNALATKP
jgi:hypothetical protein